jgi:hypothetical protein
MDQSKDKLKKKPPGVIDIVIFDGASNIVKVGKLLLLAINYPRITCLRMWYLYSSGMSIHT